MPQNRAGAELTKISQTQNELLGHLAEQIIFLINSSNSFDDGFQCEAKRVATTIRVLLHDNPPHSVSLLTQLNKKILDSMTQLVILTLVVLFPNGVY